MKVAVFICGQPKFFDPCLQSQLDFFRASGFVFDYFIHTWTNSSYIESPEQKKSGQWLKNNLVYDKSELRKLIENSYKPKKLSITNISDNRIESDFLDLVKSSKDHKRNHKLSTYINSGNRDIKYFLDGWGTGQSFSIEKSSELCDFSKYDACIKIRQDIFFDQHTEEEKSKFFNAVVSKDSLFLYRIFNEREVSDAVFASRADVYSGLFGDIYKFHISSLHKVFKDVKGTEVSYKSFFGNEKPSFSTCLNLIAEKARKEKVKLDCRESGVTKYPRYSIFRDYHMSCWKKGFSAILEQIRKEWS